MPVSDHAPHTPDVFALPEWAVTGGALGHVELMFWLREAALAGWQASGRGTPGGQPRYAGVVMGPVLALRRVKVFSHSVLALLGVELAASDHTALPAARHDRPMHFVLSSTRRLCYEIQSGYKQWYGPCRGTRMSRGCWTLCNGTVPVMPKSLG